MSVSVHPIFERVRADLSTALDAGSASQAEITELIGQLGRGEQPAAPAAYADVLRRMAWLLFIRAPQLDPRYVALSPMSLGFLATGQRSFSEMIDELCKLELANPGSETDSLESLLTTHGDALGALLIKNLGGSASTESRMRAMMDTMTSKARAHAAEGRWEAVPIPGPDAPAIRLTLRSLPNDQALDIYDAWLQGESLAAEEKWAEAITAVERAISVSDTVFESFVRRARYRFGAGERIKAGADLQRALSLFDGSSSAHAMRAELRVIIKDLTGSLQDWDDAVRIAPNHVAFRVGRAYTRVGAGQLDAAFEDFDKAVELAPEDTTPLYNRADAHVRRRDLPAAIADYDTVLTLTPGDIQARMNRATVHVMNRDAEAAIADFDHVIDARPTHIMAFAKRGSAQLQRGRPWPAWLDAATSLAVAESDWEHRETLERFLQGAHQQLSGAEHAAVSVEDVAARFNHLRTKATGTEVLQLAAVLDQFLPAELVGLHMLRANAYLDYAKWEKAVDAFGDALQVDDRLAPAWLGRGRALLQAQRLPDALTALDRARSLAFDLDDDATFELHLARGRAAGSSHKLQLAIEAFGEALALKPQRADVWFYQGVHLDLAGDQQGALSAYDHSIEHDPAFAPAWFNRACEHAVLGHRDEALSDLQRAIALDPQWKAAAPKDTYLETLWGDEAFKALVIN